MTRFKAVAGIRPVYLQGLKGGTSFARVFADHAYSNALEPAHHFLAKEGLEPGMVVSPAGVVMTVELSEAQIETLQQENRLSRNTDMEFGVGKEGLFLFSRDIGGLNQKAAEIKNVNPDAEMVFVYMAGTEASEVPEGWELVAVESAEEAIKAIESG